MKNPWMSLWLSEANKVTGAARGQMTAEMRKTQTAMMQEWQRAWMEAWLTMWGMGTKKR